MLGFDPVGDFIESLKNLALIVLSSGLFGLAVGGAVLVLGLLLSTF